MPTLKDANKTSSSTSSSGSNNPGGGSQNQTDQSYGPAGQQNQYQTQTVQPPVPSYKASTHQWYFGVIIIATALALLILVIVVWRVIRRWRRSDPEFHP